MSKLSKRDFLMLGLNSEEAKVIEILKKNKSHKVTKIAEITDLPRTTVYFLLNKLEERGLAKKIKVKNHKEWTLNQNEIILKKLEGLKNFFSFNISSIQQIGIPDLEIMIVKGENGIKNVYNEMLKVGKNERVYFIQSPILAEIVWENNRMEKGYFLDFHEKIRKEEIILEGISGEKILELFKKLTKKELKSHLGRLLVSFLVPDEYVDFEMDIVVFKNTVYFINGNEKRTILMKSEIIAKIFKNLIQFIGEHAKKVDINGYIKELLDNQQRD